MRNLTAGLCLGTFCHPALSLFDYTSPIPGRKTKTKRRFAVFLLTRKWQQTFTRHYRLAGLHAAKDRWWLTVIARFSHCYHFWTSSSQQMFSQNQANYFKKDNFVEYFLTGTKLNGGFCCSSFNVSVATNGNMSLINKVERPLRTGVPSVDAVRRCTCFVRCKNEFQ